MTCIPTRSPTGSIHCWPRRLTCSAASRGQMMMRRIDELHLKLPFAGARAWCDIPRAEHLAVGRKHMPTPMRHMGITAAGSQPEHEHPSAGALGLPLPAADAGDGHQLHSCRAWLRLSGRRDRLAQPHAGLAPVDHDGHGVRQRGRRRRRSSSTASRRSSTPTRAVNLGSGNRRNIDFYNTRRTGCASRRCLSLRPKQPDPQRPLVNPRNPFRSSGPALQLGGCGSPSD